MCTDHDPVMNYFRKPDKQRVNRQSRTGLESWLGNWGEDRGESGGNIGPVEVRRVTNTPKHLLNM